MKSSRDGEQVRFQTEKSRDLGEERPRIRVDDTHIIIMLTRLPLFPSVGSFLPIEYFGAVSTPPLITASPAIVSISGLDMSAHLGDFPGRKDPVDVSCPHGKPTPTSQQLYVEGSMLNCSITRDLLFERG